jgi:hypothetical protein
MSKRFLAIPVALAAMVVSLIAPPASAATLSYNYFAYSGGSIIRALGTTISSDLTAQSGISGTAVPNSNSNKVASAKVDGLLSLGGVQTKTSSAASGLDGIQLTSDSQTLGVSLLNGLITADAVTTHNTTTGSPLGITGTASTQFLNIKIAGVDLPLNIPKNYKVSIPGVATIVLNGSVQTMQDGGILYNQGYGVGIWLLQPYGGAPTGSTIFLNPTFAALAPGIPVNQPQTGGYAYGTQVLVSAGSDVSGQVGKTAAIGTPPGGTGGKTSTNTTATANVPDVLKVGAITSTTTATVSATSAEVTNTNEIAGVNLFDGLITADAIKVTAHTKKVNGVLTHDMKLEFVNLVVAGNAIPVNVGPNTTINVAGLGTVVINDQLQTANANRVRGIYVKLLQPKNGLGTGAEVEVAVAASWITQPSS